MYYTTTFYKKGLLEYLAASLTSKDLSPEVINAFSLTMNKTEHIDYFLRNNLSVEEIKLSQIYSAISAMEKVMQDFHLPKTFGKIGEVYKMIYTPEKGDESKHISTSLQEYSEPTLIYSSGVNDLMRAVGANPLGIKNNYKKRDTEPNFYYTVDKAKNPDTLIKVIDDIEKNYNTILGINDTTDIYTLGAYIPKSLQNEDMDVFRYLILEYNEKLASLCKEYGATFVDTEEVGKNYNKSSNFFHITSDGHNALANYILEYMYYKKIEEEQTLTKKNITPTEITNKGALGVVQNTFTDYLQTIELSNNLTGYERIRELAIADERVRETDIFEKVLRNRTVK